MNRARVNTLILLFFLIIVASGLAGYYGALIFDRTVVNVVGIDPIPQEGAFTGTLVGILIVLILLAVFLLLGAPKEK